MTGYPTSFEEAVLRVKNGRVSDEGRYGKDTIGCKLGRNTYLFLGAGFALVRFHKTEIVRFEKDGTIHLNTAGWQTVTTRDRITECGIRMGMSGGVAYFYWHGKCYVYRDGVVLHPNGAVEGTGDIDLGEAVANRKRNLKRNKNAERWYTKTGTNQFRGGNAPEAFEK